MNLEQVLEKVQEAGWSDAHIFESGVLCAKNGLPVRWVWAMSANMVLTSRTATDGQGMQITTSRTDVPRSNFLSFSDVDKSPTPAQVAQIFSMVE